MILIFLLSLCLYCQSVDLYIGEQRTIPVPGATQITIAGQGKVARGVLTADNSQMVISGVSAGEVSLTVSFKDGRREGWTVRVSGRETELLHIEASALIAGYPSLSLRRSGSQVSLQGIISGEEEDKRVRLIGERYPEIINMTRDSRADSMVQFDVEIVEVMVSNDSRLGIDWVAATTTDANFSDGVSYGKVVSASNEIVVGEKKIPDNLYPGPAYVLGPVARLSPVMARIKLMIESGKGSILARPRLVCRSGDTAVFLAGGELPIPYSTTEKAGVEWKSYGIKLKIFPEIINANGKMRLSIECAISEIDWINSVREYPAIAEKSISTKVNLQSDEMLALAGILSKRVVKIERKIPLLGSIPFVGRLFSVKTSENRSTETVITITPRLVRKGLSSIELPSIDKR